MYVNRGIVPVAVNMTISSDPSIQVYKYLNKLFLIFRPTLCIRELDGMK